MAETMRPAFRRRIRLSTEESNRNSKAPGSIGRRNGALGLLDSLKRAVHARCPFDLPGSSDFTANPAPSETDARAPLLLPHTTRRRSGAHEPGIALSCAGFFQTTVISHLPILLVVPSNGSNGTVGLYLLTGFSGLSG